MQKVRIRKPGDATTARYLLAASVLLTAASAFAGVRTVSAAIDSADRLVVTLGEASGTTNTLFMAYGAESGGDTPAGWEKIVRVGVVAADETSLVVAPPAGWESTVHAVRFFAVDGVFDGDLPVEYIAGEDANVTFPLNYVPTSDTRTQIKFMYTHHNGSTFFGTQYGTDDSNDYRFFQGKDNSTAYFDVGSARVNSANVLTDPTAIRHFELGNHYIKDLDTDSDIVRAESAVDLTGYSSSLQLFAGGDYGRVYSLKIYEGETLALDLEPCVKADGTPAFRDTLTGDFYEATGAGVVSSGKPKVLLDGETQKQMSAVVEDAVSAAPVTGDYAKRLRVTPDAIAVTGLTTFSDVPVLLRLSTAITGFDYADFTRGGKDMLILDQEGTALSYEIETWNPNGESLVWVKVPSLSVHTQLMAYYGDKYGRRNAANDPRQVWSAYAGVWHMDEQQTAGSCADSSPNAYHTQNQEGNTGAAGFLGGARNAASGGMIVPGTTAMNLGTSFTVMGLVTRTSTVGNWDHLFYKKNASGDWGGWCVEMYGEGGAYGKMSVLGRDSRKGNDNITHGIAVTDTWYHILITYDNLTARVYNNGVAKGSGSFAYAPTWTGDNIRNLAFGCASNGSGAGWSGLFDEFRICAGAMSAERVALEYALMQPDAVALAVFDNDVDPLALGDCSLVSNGDGTYAATATLSSGSAASVKVVLSNGAEFELASSGATAPIALNGTVSGLSANLSFVADVVATSAGGDIAAKQISGTFYNGSVSVVKTADALEETLEPGAFVFSRAEGADATGFDLVVHYAVGGTATAGSDYETLSGETTIPAGASSVTVTVSPKKNLEVDDDVTVVATVAEGNYRASDSSASVVILNARSAILAKYAKRLPLSLKDGVVAEGAALANFPVLVRLKETVDGFSYSDFEREDFADLAFVDKDGEQLPYEIEAWDPQGTSLVWVRVPELTAESAIYALYGSSEATENNPKSVWTAYSGVWHLNEPDNGAVAIHDATVNGIDGVGFDANTAVSAGKIGAARGGRAILTDPGTILTDISSTVSVSMWVRLSESGKWHHLVTAIHSESDGRWGFQLTSSANLRFWNDGKKEPRMDYGTALSVNEWVRFDCVYNGSEYRLYRNGVLTSTLTGQSWPNGQKKATNKLAFGGLVDTTKGDNTFTGALDEIRLSNTVLPGEWFAATYKFETEDCFDAGAVVTGGSDLPAVGSAYADTVGGTDVIAIPLLAGSGTVYAILRDVATGTVTTNAVSDGVVSAGTYYLPISALPVNRYCDVAVYATGANGAHDSRTYSVRVRNAKETKIVLRAAGYSGNDVADFPALVRLSGETAGFGYDNLFDKAAGSDIHFQDESGNELAFDCDTWNPEGESLFWVKMPILRCGAKVFLLYGVEHAANTAANRVAVWSGQTGVWHLDGTGHAYNSAAEDVNSLRGWNNGTVYADAGVAGGARLLSKSTVQDAKEGHIVVSKSTALNLGNTFTVSGWFKYYNKNQNTGYDRLFGYKTKWDSSDGWEVTLIKGSSGELGIRGGTSASCNAVLSSPINDGEWHFLTIAYTGTTASVYENGVRILEDGNIGTAAGDSSVDFVIGNNGSKDEVTFKGTVDEVRYGAGTLSADRIKADYETVANADFFSAGVYKPGFFVIVR